MAIENILVEIDAEIARLKQARALLATLGTAAPTAGRKAKKAPAKAKTRFFLVLALAGAFFALRPAVGAAVPSVASSARACFNLAISASISTRMFSIAINQG